MPAAGLPDGTYTLGPTAITVSGGIRTCPSGQLSGGMGTPLESTRRLMELGAGMPEAVGSVTEVPARLMGRGDIGRLAIGAAADLLIVDETLQLYDVFKDGLPLD